MNLVSRILIRLTAEIVGSDDFGNRYYEARRESRLGRRKRFVVYRGKAEASKVPPEWWGWLHYTEDSPPSPEASRRYAWQKEHVPNLTGTIYAHRPSGSLLRGGKRQPATGDYEAWHPQK